MCIDHSGRRLITGSRLGQAKGWDVTTGELMQTFLAASPNETTSLVPLGKKNLLFSAGWAKEIVTYKDRPEKASLFLIVVIICQLEFSRLAGSPVQGQQRLDFPKS